MKQLQLPKMSTDKPSSSGNQSENTDCYNHLQQNFTQRAQNLAWVSNITYIKAGGKWHYLCIVMDLYYEKIISWHISSNAGVDLVITAFRKAYEKRNAPYGLMFHSDRGSQYTAFTFRQLQIFFFILQNILFYKFQNIVKIIYSHFYLLLFYKQKRRLDFGLTFGGRYIFL